MWQILSGIIGGLAVAIAGAAKKGDETFEWGKFITTIAVGLIIGIVALATNQDYGIVANSAGIAGLTTVIENLGKGIYRKLTTPSA